MKKQHAEDSTGASEGLPSRGDRQGRSSRGSPSSSGTGLVVLPMAAKGSSPTSISPRGSLSPSASQSPPFGTPPRSPCSLPTTSAPTLASAFPAIDNPSSTTTPRTASSSSGGGVGGIARSKTLTEGMTHEHHPRHDDDDAAGAGRDDAVPGRRQRAGTQQLVSLGAEGTPSTSPQLLSFKDRQRRMGGRYGSGSPRSSLGACSSSSVTPRQALQGEDASESASGWQEGAEGQMASPITPLPPSNAAAAPPPSSKPSASPHEGSNSSSSPTLSFKDRLRAASNTSSPGSSLIGSVGVVRRRTMASSVPHSQQQPQQQQPPTRPSPTREEDPESPASPPQPAPTPTLTPSPPTQPIPPRSGSLPGASAEAQTPTPSRQHTQVQVQGQHHHHHHYPLQHEDRQPSVLGGCTPQSSLDGDASLLNSPQPHDRTDTLVYDSKVVTATAPSALSGASSERPSAAASAARRAEEGGQDRRRSTSPPSMEREDGHHREPNLPGSDGRRNSNSHFGTHADTRRGSVSANYSFSIADMCTGGPGLRVCEEGEPEPVRLSMATLRPLDADPIASASLPSSRGDTKGTVGDEGEGREGGVRALKPRSDMDPSHSPPPPVPSSVPGHAHGEDDTGSRRPSATSTRSTTGVRFSDDSNSGIGGMGGGGGGAPRIDNTQTFVSPTKTEQLRHLPSPQGHSSPSHHPHASVQKNYQSPGRKSSQNDKHGAGGRIASAAPPAHTGDRFVRTVHSTHDILERSSVAGTRKERGKMLGPAFGLVQPSLPPTGGGLASTTSLSSLPQQQQQPLRRRGMASTNSEIFPPTATTTAAPSSGATSSQHLNEESDDTHGNSTAAGTPEPTSPAHSDHRRGSNKLYHVTVHGERRPQSPAEEVAHMFLHNLGHQHQHQRSPSQTEQSDDAEQKSGGRKNWRQEGGPISLDSTPAIADDSDTDVAAEQQQQQSSRSHSRKASMGSREESLAGTGGSHSGLMLSGTRGGFAATRDNRRTSTFSSLQFSVKRRGKANAAATPTPPPSKQQKRKVKKTLALGEHSDSDNDEGEGRDSAVDADDGDGMLAKVCPAKKGGGDDETERGAMDRGEGDWASEDEEDDDGVASAVETKGDSRGSEEQHDETSAFLAEMEEDNALLQRRVGMWETAEHIFIPIYETLQADTNLEEVITRGLRESAGSPVSVSESQTSSEVVKAAVASPDSSHTPQFLSPILSPKLRSNSSSSPLLLPSANPKHGSIGNTAAAATSAGVTATASPTSQSNSGRASFPGASSVAVIPVCSPKAGGGGGERNEGDREDNETRKGEEVRGGATFAFGSIAANYNVEPTEEDPSVDCKVAARLLFDPDHGTMLLVPHDEVERYGNATSMAYNRTSRSPLRLAAAADLGTSVGSASSSSGNDKRSASTGNKDEEDEGACGCTEDFIGKDSRGMNYSKYHAHTLYDHCICCQRRPGCFLCLHCFKSVCPTHVRRHYRRNPTKCTLYLNILDIMNSFDRIFWCEKCQQFTWKYTEIYDPLVDQIAYTRGTYLPRPVRDIHCFGVETVLQEEQDHQSPLAVAATSFALATASTASSSMVVAEGSSVGRAYSPPHLPPRRRSNGQAMDEMNCASSWTASARCPASPGGQPQQQQVVYTMNSDSSFSPVRSAAPNSTTPLAPSPQAAAVHFSRNAVGPSSRGFATNFSSSPGAVNPATASGASNANDSAGAPAPRETQPSPPLVGTVATSSNAAAGGVSFGMWLPTAGSPGASATFSHSSRHLGQQNNNNNTSSSISGPQSPAFCGGSRAQAACSPMADMLSRDTAALAQGNVLPVGNAVSKLSALAASVQGWRATQEDAEAAFLVYIPALKAEADEASSRKRDRLGNSRHKEKDSPLLPAEGQNTREKEEEGVASGEAAEAEEKIPMAVFCVFDGHGGDAVAKLAAGHFESHLRRAIAQAWPDDIRARALLFQVRNETSFSPRQRALSHASNQASLAPSMSSPMASIITMPLGAHSPDHLARQRHSNEAVLAAQLTNTGSHSHLLTASGVAGGGGGGGYRFAGPLLVPGAVMGGAGAGQRLCDDNSSHRLDSVGSSPSPRLLPSANSGTNLAGNGDGGEGSLRADEEREGGEEATNDDGSSGAAVCPGYTPTLLAPVTAASLALHVSAASAADTQQTALSPRLSEAHSNANQSNSNNQRRQLPTVRSQELETATTVTGKSGTISTNIRSPKVLVAQAQQERTSNLVRQWEQESLAVLSLPSTTAAASTAGGLAACLPAGLSRATADRGNEDSSNNILTAGDASASGTQPNNSTPLLRNQQPSQPLLVQGVRRDSRGGTRALDPQLALCPASVVAVSEAEMLRNYFASIMEDALLSLDEYLHNTEEGQRGDYNCVGCTACIVGITPIFILCANVGDSGACFYSRETIESIAIKHRLSDPRERARVTAAGYTVSNDRIEGMLAVPRALGDFDFKQCGGKSAREQAVTALPDVTIRPIPTTTTAMVASTAAVSGAAGVDGDNAEDRWGILLACDGVWDTATLHQIHHALVNTPNDLDVASSAVEASMRAKDLARHHRRGPVHYLEDTPAKGPGSAHSSPISAQELQPMPRIDPNQQAFPTADQQTREVLRREGEQRGDLQKERDEERQQQQQQQQRAGEPRPLHGVVDDAIDGDNDDESYVDDVGGDPQATDGIDARLLTAAAGIFAQCIAPADNEEGVGLDNCSLILVERRA